jgi:hypothetical protein
MNLDDLMYTILLSKTRFGTWQCRVSYSIWNDTLERFEGHRLDTREGKTKNHAIDAAMDAIVAISLGQEPERAVVRVSE